MGANDYILAVYAVSGSLALGCAILPGAGPIGRLLNVLTGIGLLGWTCNAYLRDGWYTTNPTILVVPLLLLVYAGITLGRFRNRYQDEWYSPAYRSAGRRAAHAMPPAPDRRAADRRPLPGEYGNVPINQLPPPHDPWAALYASTERERLRRDSGRHRLAAQATTGLITTGASRHAATDPAAAAARSRARHTEYEVLLTAYANAEAEFDAWRARCSEQEGPRERSWFDDWSEPDE